MKLWQRLPVNILLTAILSMFCYVGLIAILNEGKGLGDPIWKGFLLQVGFHSIFGLAVLALLVGPIYILLNRFIDSRQMVMLFTFFMTFTSLMFLYFQMQAGFWPGSLVPSILGAGVFIAIEKGLGQSSQ